MVHLPATTIVEAAGRRAALTTLSWGLLTTLGGVIIALDAVSLRGKIPRHASRKSRGKDCDNI